MLTHERAAPQTRWPGRLFLLLFTAVLLAFVHRGPPAPEAARAEEKRSYDPLTTRPNDEGDAGARLYRRYCGGCHGEQGDGKGPAAVFLSPRPRDFTVGLYKFTSTPAGSPPLEEDIVRSITNGLHGTSMPAWRLLPEHDRRLLARYVKAFHKEWETRSALPAVPFHENPFPLDDREQLEAAVVKGREVYHKTATCWSCHPAYMERQELETLLGGPSRPDLAVALGKPDAWGETILPPDFKSGTLKSVRGLRDLYQVITAGVGGTAMPTWKGALTAEQLWALTLYVDSLRPSSTVLGTIEKLKKEGQ
jgi:mono/diheme cytochrome c family protein